MSNPKFIEQIKRLSSDEINRLELSTISAMRLVDTIGIAVSLIVISFFTYAPVVFFGAVTIGVLANIAVKVNIALNDIRVVIKTSGSIDK